ncbi:MAG TPA: TIGR00730 family Rossman fold protein [Bacteroidales bacterium]|nr:TIGR00730 family Rossman fold protein [Bacteroidales bacterium]
MNICVFAASSSKTDTDYVNDARRLGELLAGAGHNIIYGGGGIGLMGAMADAAMKGGAKVTGVIPEFMHDNGWGHKDIDELILTADMGSRKKKMFELSDALVALPGGIGTLEELTEAITMKQLGLYKGALVILNTNSFYDGFLNFLESLINLSFMRSLHAGIWKVASGPEEVIEAIKEYRDWFDDPASIARI